MTRLQEQILQAVEKAHFDFGNATGGNEDYFIAIAAEKVCLEWIEKAYLDGQDSMDKVKTPTFQDWLKENNLL